MTAAPLDALTEPTPRDPIPNVVNEMLSIPSLVSPSYWAAELIRVAIGTNPLAEAARAVGGDWNGLAKAAEALRNVAEFGSRTAGTLDTGAAAMRTAWDGEAAAAAGDYFGRLATSVRDQGPVLAELARNLDQAAAGIWNIAQAVQALLQELGDRLILAAASMAAGTALIWTGAGAAAGYAVTAHLIAQLSTVWVTVLQHFGHVVTACKALIGVLATATAQLRDLEGPALPAAPYDHPGAQR